MHGQTGFAQWYRNGAPSGGASPGQIVLWDNGAGGFVNRWGANGEQWQGKATYANIMYGGPVGMGCGMCTPSAAGKCFDPATKEVRLPKYGTLANYEQNIEWNVHRWCGYYGRGI